MRSIHNCQGQFLWLEPKAVNLFNLSAAELKKTSIFQIMTKNSRKYLYRKHGQFIASNCQRRVITYQVDRCGVELSSRISPIIF